MEPLVEDYAGPPVYLKRLSAEGRRQYKADLLRVGEGFRKIAPDVPEKTRMAKILRSIDNVQKELSALPA